MSSEIVWQLVRKHNCFLRKGRTGNRVALSAEPGNLYNKHSYKYSGLADPNTIDIQPGEGSSIVVTTSSRKNKNKPKLSKNTYTTKKNPRRVATSVGKETKRTRPDLQRAAQARVSAIAFLQRKQKAAGNTN